MPTQSETFESSALVIRNGLKHWYKRRHATYPSEVITRIAKFGKKQIGTWDDRKLKTKGAQTWFFFLYLVDVLEERIGRCDAEAAPLLSAAKALRNLNLIWQTAKVVLTATQEQYACDSLKRFLHLTNEIEEIQQPNRHLITHLIAKSGWLGAPVMYANWRDESLQKTLKAFCRQVSQTTFEPFLLLRMREYQRRGAKRSA